MRVELAMKLSPLEARVNEATEKADSLRTELAEARRTAEVASSEAGELRVRLLDAKASRGRDAEAN